MTQPTYEQLAQACSLLFHSYVRTIDTIQNEWGNDMQLDDRASRTMSGLFGTLKIDAATHKFAPLDELVGAMTAMNLIESADETDSTGHRDDDSRDDTW